MSREVMQMALEALESDPISHTGLVNRKQAIAALRQALVDADDISEKRVDEKAKREHEPVAWANTLDFDDDDIEIIPAKNKGKLGTGNCDIPLYTAPQKQWVGLTDEEYKIIHYKNYNYIELAQAVEAKLKEKNNA